jgi:hypothetical protein
MTHETQIGASGLMRVLRAGSAQLGREAACCRPRRERRENHELG